jgi:hypothetical protein
VAVWLPPGRFPLAIGADPGYSGRGAGSAVLRAGTDQADAAGQACWLETQEEPTVGWYQRFGFTVQGPSAGLPRRVPLLAAAPSGAPTGSGTGVAGAEAGVVGAVVDVVVRDRRSVMGTVTLDRVGGEELALPLRMSPRDRKERTWERSS